VDTIDAIRFSTTAVLNAFASDGVRYLELRTTPRAVITAGISKHDYISTVLDCISDFTQKNQNKMPTYLILSVDRKNSASVAMQTIDLAIEFRSKGVVGVDLCGNPAKGDVSIFKDAFLKARQAGLRLTLHFAEVPASSTEKELKTLLSYEPDRLGHVIHVPSEIAGEIASRKLGLELCLSCNVLAKLTECGFGDHHFGYWRQQHCPIILCVSHSALQVLFVI
jgi:adenosine deaminase